MVLNIFKCLEIERMSYNWIEGSTDFKNLLNIEQQFLLENLFSMFLYVTLYHLVHLYILISFCYWKMNLWEGLYNYSRSCELIIFAMEYKFIYENSTNIKFWTHNFRSLIGSMIKTFKVEPIKVKSQVCPLVVLTLSLALLKSFPFDNVIYLQFLTFMIRSHMKHQFVALQHWCNL